MNPFLLVARAMPCEQVQAGGLDDPGAFLASWSQLCNSIPSNEALL